MRPLNKGNTPTDSTGNPISPTDYKSWRKALIDRIGAYCAYCNMPIKHALQVEHVVPKNPPAGYTVGDPLAWSNMLLACGPCNNAKGNTPVDSITFYLPEEHNTHLPFVIVPHATDAKHAIVTERPGLNVNQFPKAQRTIALTELNATDERPNIVDLRSRERKLAAITVNSTRNIYNLAAAINPILAAEHVVHVASRTGFFSLWYEEFMNEPLVMERLTDNTIIQGTATNCFDPANGYQPIPRNPANIADPI